MPLYQYCCDDCGPFDDMARVAEYADPKNCPACGIASPRMIAAPRLAILDSSTRHAHQTNEKSAHEPKKSSHGPGCGCCGGGSKKINSSTLHRPDGSKSFPTKRPWMISH
ncbi:zinc ribbon domain-containing protein [Sneathiella sp.]|uniref:FmdB family zinc ribbon protein n=1 Tax=Sneathiella sp. TaxID=1964365 RepID=UPI00261737F0|nr:zinc ribbon domain-containing protein [Sneathiella sp.]MDF2366837.1 zinc ribbon domain-containing protein [Sneathiella sp.]